MNAAALEAIGWVRIVLASLVLLVLLYETFDRAVNEDYSDPSFSVGRDYGLVRASGIVLIGAMVGIAALLLAPELLGSDRGVVIGLLLVAILGYWTVSETAEGD